MLASQWSVLTSPDILACEHNLAVCGEHCNTVTLVLSGTQRSSVGRIRLQSTGRIKVWNNGQGVPVEMHKKENVYVPELIFGHLLTSSNYEDKQKKVHHR